MAGKFITQQQAQHIGGLLVGMVAVMEKHEHRWTRQQGEDLRLAFLALGVPCPFEFRDPTPEEQKADEPSLIDRAKSLILGVS